MKKLLKLLLIFFVFCLFSLSSVVIAQNQSETLDDVKLFDSFFRDSPITVNPYGELGLGYGDFDFISLYNVRIQGGFAITPEIELGTQLTFQNWSPDIGDSESGITDIPVFGRYNFVAEEQTKVSGGIFLTLPVGEENIGGGRLDFGFFGAVRHAINNNTVLTGTLGLTFLEEIFEGAGRETSLNLGGGIIYAATDELHIIGELVLETEFDYAVLIGGVDYAITDTGRLRGALIVGLDDGAPDFGLTGSYFLFF